MIVTGVLVALTVDAWQQRLGESELAREHLQSLADDLAVDSAMLGDVRSLLDVKQASLTVLQGIAGGSEFGVSPDSVIGLLFPSAVLGWRIPESQNAAYEELMSTGGLRFFEDRELRSQIVFYYEQWGHQLERLDRHRSVYPNLIYQLLPPEVAQNGEPFAGDAASLVRLIRTDEMRAQLNHEANYARVLSEVVALFEEWLSPLLEAVRSHLTGGSA